MTVRHLAVLAGTEVVIVGGFISPLLLGSTGVVLLALALGLLSADELVALQRPSLAARIGLAILFAAAFWVLWQLPAAPALTLAGGVMLLLAAPQSDRVVALLAIYPVVFASFLVPLFDLRQGIGFIVFTYVVTESCDTFALLIGKQFGRRRPFRLSPQKTIEGVTAGIIGGALVGVGTGAFLGWPLPFSAGIALILACTTVLGDLAASRIKRFCGVKDFGNVLPLQGGILDIYDSTLFNLPVALLISHLSGGLTP